MRVLQKMIHDPCQDLLLQLEKFCIPSKCRLASLYMLKVPTANWLALKMQIWLIPSKCGQHSFLGVSIGNQFSVSSIEERYQALNLPLAGIY